MEPSSPARLYAHLIGGLLVVIGVVGFFYAAGFDTGASICANNGCDKVFGVFAVNGWSNLLHIAVGAVGLICVTYGLRLQRAYAFYAGIFWIAVSIAGFAGLGSGSFNDNTIFKVIPVNTADNFLYLALGVLGIGAALTTPRSGMPKPAGTTAAAETPTKPAQKTSPKAAPKPPSKPPSKPTSTS
jgi:hypothetical protein